MLLRWLAALDRLTSSLRRTGSALSAAGRGWTKLISDEPLRSSSICECGKLKQPGRESCDRCWATLSPW